MKDKLRENNICLNCGAVVHGRYCSECGQENREPRESFDKLLLHFLSDFTHFDSKIFITVKDLILKPGFLTKEYLAGKRARYIHPIRMYLFISFLCFFVIYLINSHNDNAVITAHTQDQTVNRIEAAIDTVRVSIDTAKANHAAIAVKALTTTNKSLLKIDGFINAVKKYNSVERFDKGQKRLSSANRLKGMYYVAARKVVAWKQKYGDQAKEIAMEKFLHLIPKVMFVLLPLFAVFLRWFYKKDHLYTDHIIFSLHFHTFAFLLMLVFMLLNTIFSVSFFGSIGILLLFIYLVLALRYRYRETTMHTLLKSIGISVLYGISMCIGLLAAAIITFVTV